MSPREARRSPRGEQSEPSGFFGPDFLAERVAGGDPEAKKGGLL
jgi:hypothetical protein